MTKCMNLIVLVLVIALAVIINYLIKDVKLSVLNSDFLVNFFGVFLGIMVAVITLLFGMVDKIKTALETSLGTEKAGEVTIRETKELVKGVFNELKQDTIFIFFLLIINLIMPVIENVNFYSIDLPFGLSKYQLINIIKIMSVTLGLIAIWDAVLSIFNLVNGVLGILIDKEEIENP